MPFKISETVIVAIIAVLQFTKIFNSSLGKWAVVGLAIAYIACVAASELSKRRAERIKEAKQEERDRELIRKAVLEYKASIETVVQPLPSAAPPIELGMSADDPRLYLNIGHSTDAMFRKTPFILRNDGKDVAHTAQIQPFKLKRKDVTFAPIEIIPAGEKRNTLPTVNSHEPMTEHDIFNWLLKDWDGNGELVDEWPVPLTVEYSDFSKKKKFVASMTLVFYPIRFLLDEKHNWPTRNYDHPLWEFRGIEFKRVS